MSSGDSYEGGHYLYDNTWLSQSHEGVMWLTDYKSDFDEDALSYAESRDSIELTHVSRLKTVRLGTNQILLLFEVFKGDNYRYTGYLVVNDEGRPLSDGVVKQFCTRLLKGDQITWDAT